MNTTWTLLAMGLADARDAVEAFRLATKRNYDTPPKQYGQSRYCQQIKRRNRRAARGRK